MKRWIALTLALLLFTGTAGAAEWIDGTSPGKPYQGMPEIDLNERMGYMVFYPGKDIPVANACQRLYIYLPREDVQAGDGILYVFTEEDGEIWSTPMTSAEAVTRRPMTEAELDGLLWGGGLCFEILLPRTLDLGQTYYVNITRGGLVTDGGLENPQIGGSDAWRFTLEGDYGVSGMEYRRPLADGSFMEALPDPQVGDEIRFTLTLGGDAARAVLYGRSGSVDFLTTMLTESGEVTGTVTSANPTWGVQFLDAQGNELNRVDFWQQ